MPPALSAAARRLARIDPIRRDAALALVLFAGLLVDSVLCPEGRGISPLGVLAALAGTLPLAVRTRAPLRVALWLGLMTIPVLATLKPVDTVALPVVFALYTVAASGDRRRSLLVAAFETPLVIAIVAAFSPGELMTGATVQNVAVVLTALACGDAVRSRCGYLASMRERAERQLAEERLSIARDLHDSVAHAITAINVQAGVAAHLLGRRPEAARDALLDIRRVSGEALGDLRSTLHLLREGTPAPLRPAPSLDGLDELVARVRAAGVAVSVDVQGSAGHVPVAVDAAAHRIVQEALTNVLRHSRAHAAAVTVRVGEDAVELEVIDDGDGAATAERTSEGAGFGLLGMRERALGVGGSVDAGGAPGGGWRVHALLPLTAA